MNQEIRKMLLDGIKNDKLFEVIVKSVKEIGKEETFLVVKEIYLENDIDIFKPFYCFDQIKNQNLKSDFFYLREIVRDLIPFAKYEHVYSVMLCLNFYLKLCDPSDLLLSRVLDNLPELLNQNKEFLFLFVDILENESKEDFHFLLISSVLVSLCKTDPDKAKNKIFKFLEKNNDSEQVGAIAALPMLTGFDSEILVILKEKLNKTQSDWVISNIVMVLLKVCERDKTYISEVVNICQSCLEKNTTLARYFIRYPNLFNLGRQFEKIIIKAVEQINPRDEDTIHHLDFQLSRLIMTKSDFVLEILDKLLVRLEPASEYLFTTLKDIRKDKQLLAKTIFHWLSKSERKYWQLCAEISRDNDDTGIDLSDLAPYIDSLKQATAVSTAVLLNRITCGMFLVPKSALSLLFLLFKRIDDQSEASDFLDNLICPLAVCYSPICIQTFESKISELNSTQKELVKSFLNKVTSFNEEIVNAKEKLCTLRTTEIESLTLDEFENIKLRDLYQIGMEKSIINKLGIHHISILYGRGTFYYQRDADDNMKNKQVSKLGTFTRTVTWPLMLIVCPAVLEEILFIKGIEAKE